MVKEGLLYDLGEYGPYLMGVMSLPVLWKKQFLLNYSLVGLCLNIILNSILKFIFKGKRPDWKPDWKRENPEECWIAFKKRTDFIDSVQRDPFGMPSGHSQNASYLAGIMYFAFGIKPITMLFVLYTFGIMYQRVKTRMHTIPQVIAGAITGVVVAACVYYSCRNGLIGQVMHKLDDWSRIF